MSKQRGTPWQRVRGVRLQRKGEEQRGIGVTHRGKEKGRKVRCRSDDQKQFARGLASSISGGGARG